MSPIAGAHLCSCVKPRLVKDGTCSVCSLRCLGDTTPEQNDELIETLYLIAMGHRRPMLAERKAS